MNTFTFEFQKIGKRKMRAAAAIAATLVFAVVLAGTPQTQANATPLGLGATEEEYQALSEWLVNYGVDQPTANTLIQAARDGDVWDSMGGNAPTSVSSSVNADGIGVTVSTFSDGSIRVSSIGIDAPVGPSTSPSSGVTSRSVSGCTVVPIWSGAADYFDCVVQDSSGIVTARFQADVRRTAVGSTILAALPSEGEVYVSAGTYSGKSGPTITRANSSGAVPATARMTWTANTGLGTFSQYEELRVPTSGSMTSVGSF